MTTDRELIEQIVSGCPQAFGALYDRYAPRIYGLVIRVAGSRDDAEDILQDVFWRIWRHAGSYDPERSSVPVWILLQARSRAIDWVRRQGRRDTVRRNAAQDAGPVGEVASIGDPRRRAVEAETGVQAHEVIETLPVEQRELIRLSFFRGLSHTQIATHLSLPVGTVKTRIRSGMQTLRDVGLRNGLNGTHGMQGDTAS